MSSPFTMLTWYGLLLVLSSSKATTTSRPRRDSNSMSGVSGVASGYTHSAS